MEKNCTKVKREDTKVRDKEFSWKATKKELKNIGREWAYGDPVPPDMRELDLQELQQVAIDWRMLTPIRPKLRQDEEMFSRLVRIDLTQLIFHFLNVYRCKNKMRTSFFFHLFVLQGGDGQIRGEDHNERTPFANEPY